MKEPVIMVKDWKEEAEMGDPPQTRPLPNDCGVVLN
jgi:hypothetical protein